MTQKPQFILIGDDRYRLSIIKRYYPSNAAMDNNPKPYFLNVCTTVKKQDGICIGFKTAKERQVVLNNLDKHFGI